MIKRQNTMRRGMVSPAMWLLIATWLLIAAAPAFGEVVEGFVDGFEGDCDGPGTPCSAGTGFVGVFGWASAPSGIQRVEILIESVQFPGTVSNLGRAFYGLERDGLGPVGWAYNINSPLFPNGLYDVWARVVTLDGTVAELAPKQVLFTNTTTLLRPFGEIERPGHNEDVFGTCDRSAGRIRYAVISGWALDLGVAGDQDTGISWVELKVNGALWGNTRTGCEFYPQTGGLTNCYGLPRLDLENEYPFAFDAPSAGYRFVLDVGFMLENDYVTPGSNELIVRAGDWGDQTANIDRVSVNFLCAEDFSEPSFGEIEVPRAGRLYSGPVSFQGWALDGEGVEMIDIYIDGLFEARLLADAAFSDIDMSPGSAIPGGFGSDGGVGFGIRPLVSADYPGYEDTEAPVWQLTGFDTSKLTDGFHTLQVRVTDDEGDSNFIGGEVTFRVDNTMAALLGLYKPVGIEP